MFFSIFLCWAHLCHSTNSRSTDCAFSFSPTNDDNKDDKQKVFLVERSLPENNETDRAPLLNNKNSVSRYQILFCLSVDSFELR